MRATRTRRTRELMNAGAPSARRDEVSARQHAVSVYTAVGMVLAFRRKYDCLAALGSACFALLGCEPSLVVGKWRSAAGSEAGSSVGARAGTGTEGGADGGAGGEQGGAGGEAGGGAEGGAGGVNEGSTCDIASGDVPRIDDPVVVPWSTGFEN